MLSYRGAIIYGEGSVSNRRLEKSEGDKERRSTRKEPYRGNVTFRGQYRGHGRFNRRREEVSSSSRGYYHTESRRGYEPRQKEEREVSQHKEFKVIGNSRSKVNEVEGNSSTKENVVTEVAMKDAIQPTVESFHENIDKERTKAKEAMEKKREEEEDLDKLLASCEENDIEATEK